MVFGDASNSSWPGRDAGVRLEMAVRARHRALEELGLAEQLPAAPCLHQGQHQGIWWLQWC